MRKNIIIVVLIGIIISGGILYNRKVQEQDTLYSYMIHQVKDNVLTLLTTDNLKEKDKEYLVENSIKFLGATRNFYEDQNKYSSFMSDFQTIEFDKILEEKTKDFIEKYGVEKPAVESFNDFVQDLWSLK